jgi:hypothetical protein
VTVLLLGAFVERELEAALKSRMAKLQKRELKFIFDPGPLQSFDAKIKIAQALSIIGHAGVIELDIVRQIRNICAHAIHEVSFKTPEIAKGIGALRTHRLKNAGSVMEAFDRPPMKVRTAKDKFVCTCFIIWMALFLARHPAKRPRKPRDSFHAKVFF